MSKLSTLKQEAYQAGKKKNWAQAIALYEQILERDKNNPTVINELGDLCLKGGETARAVRHFLNAAAKYRATGLMNNAVAIYKKILRHETENLNAHWYLAETRANQGLVVEGENHAVHFLDNSADVTGDIKEIFLKRCRSLFDLFPESRVILSRLAQIFNMWTMPLEGARATCLLLCMDFAGGNEKEARKAMDALTAKVPELLNYPEFAKWNGLLHPGSTPAAPAKTGAFADFGSVDLGGAQPAAPVADAPAATPPAAPVDQSSFGDLALDGGTAAPAVDDTSFADVAADIDAPGEKVVEIEIEDESPLLHHASPAAEEVDDEGCFAIDDEGGSLDDLVAAAAVEVDAPSGPEAEDLAPVPSAMDALLDGPAVAAPAATADEPGVDLLAQMLEEDGPDLIA
ncbi:hypothetical protein KDM41_15225, partial [bacterium]|nr:hypothetical protein [bacterium]